MVKVGCSSKRSRYIGIDRFALGGTVTHEAVLRLLQSRFREDHMLNYDYYHGN